MAGQPEFIRSKRLKFFHTAAEVLGKGSLELAPTTSLILHPTTDLVASPEGNMIFRTAASFATDVSIMGNLYVNGTMDLTGAAHLRSSASIDGTVNAAGGGNIVVRKKAVVSYSDFTAASVDQRVGFQSVIVGDSISELFFKLATPFKYDTGPATVIGSICRVTFGDRSDQDGYCKTKLCGSSVAAGTYFHTTMGGLVGKGPYLFNAASNLPKSKVYTATSYIQCKLTASAFYVASLTQGAVHVYYDIMQLPS